MLFGLSHREKRVKKINLLHFPVFTSKHFVILKLAEPSTDWTNRTKTVYFIIEIRNLAREFRTHVEDSFLDGMQGRRKIDNWGANIHIFVFCTINNFFWNRNLDFKVNCFYSLWTRIYEHCPPPPIIDLPAPLMECIKICLFKTFREGCFA